MRVLVILQDKLMKNRCMGFFLSLYLLTIKVNITNKVVSSTQVLFYHSQPVRRNRGQESFKRQI